MNCQKEYHIRRSQRARRARIVVTADKVEVVAPLCMPEKQIQQFMRAKQSWIESAKNKVQQHVGNIASFAPESYQQGALIPYLGKQYRLQIKVSQEKRIKIAFEQDFIAYVPETLKGLELSEQVRQALTAWMGQSAAKQARKTMGHYAPLYQLSPRSIVIKTQKSRWGSCGIHNDIHLNWLLILAPAEVFEWKQQTGHPAGTPYFTGLKRLGEDNSGSSVLVSVEDIIDNRKQTT